MTYLWCFNNSRKTPKVCIESSRVGEIMTIPVPFRGKNLNLYTNSTAGIRKANVFPEPVLAFPTKSRPIKYKKSGRKIRKITHCAVLTF